MSTKAEEIAELQALLDAMPDDTDSEAVQKYEKENTEDPEEVVEIRYSRKVKRKHYHSLAHELICEECGVVFYKHLPAGYEGRLCGENCASTVLEIARDALACFLDPEAVATLSTALLARDPAHLSTGGADPRLRLQGRTIEPAYQAPEAPTEPLTLAEKIAARVRKD